MAASDQANGGEQFQHQSFGPGDTSLFHGFNNSSFNIR